MKVHELAKKLDMSSKELIEKAKSIGIEVTSANSALSEIDEKTLENAIKAKRKKDTETKIVRVASKKKDIDEKEPHVTVRAANVKTPAGKTSKVRKKTAEEEPVITRRPPIGKPVVPKEVEKRAARPVGKPLPKKIEGEDEATEKPTVTKKAAIAKKAEEANKTIRKEQREKPKVKIIKSAKEQKAEAEAKEKKEREEKRAEAKRPKTGAERPSVRPERPKAGGERASARPERPARKPSSKEAASEKPAAKKEDRTKKGKPKEKERDKFGKLEKGKRSRRPGGYEVLSLEKKAKKKHVKQKISEEPEIEEAPLPAGTKVINVPITVGGLAEQIDVSVSKIIMTLMGLGKITNINANIDEDTLLILAEELGMNVIVGSVEQETEEEGLEIFDDRETDLMPRPPIITVMGHVDHGKTSLLDAIRKTNVTASESGGITQHIGASEVEINDKRIVFLDTPGHEAFTAMRARGADVTDMAVLVVAADDSVKPQTIESISHAKAAGVPIIVAINKMDKPGANPDKVKQDLTEHNILVEEWGGDVIAVPVSAKSGEGIRNLLEMILLQAEVLELKANPERLAVGTVIEARLDKAKGPVATVLLTNGTLKAGSSVVAGTCSGRIRLMTNSKGETIRKAGPATAVEVLGLTDVPAAGDSFNAVIEDRVAKDIADKRKQKQREEVMAKTSKTSLEELFSQIKEGEIKELPLVIKGDVRGSVGAVTASLEKLSNENVKVKIVHTGVGAITESDVMLAGTSGAIIIGFNVRPAAGVTQQADREGIQIRNYRVIYDIIDDIESAMKGMLDPEFKEVVLNQVKVRETFKVPNIGIIAGAYVTEGKVIRNAQIRLVRDGVVIHEGKISSLKRFKDDAKEVQQGFECGLGIENYNDLKEDDIIECFEMQEIERD